MQSVPCPQGDGTCTIPDPAVVASDGQITLVRLSEVEQLLSSSQIDADRLHPLSTEHSLPDLMTLANRDDYDAIDAARDILAATQSNRVVIVHCTCGHLYVLDT
jgi:gluconate kinase